MLYKTIICIFLVTLTNCSTDKLDPNLAIDKPVEGGIVEVENLYSILKGALSAMSGSGYYGRDLIVTNEVRSDNCFSNGNSGRFTTEGEFRYNENTDYIWNNAYYVIATLNIIINTDVSTLSGDESFGNHIKGQAYVLRALAHYDLVRSFGQQHTSSGTLGVVIQDQFAGDAETDFFLSRSTIDEVKSSIYLDLEEGFGLLDSNFDKSKVFVAKYASKALESRVAIYFGDWTIARDAAKEVIDSGVYSIAASDEFVSNWLTRENSNSIFEISNNGNDNPGINGLANIYRYPSDEPGGYGDIQVVDEVINLYEDGDVRKDLLGYQDNGARLRNLGKYPDNVTYADNIPLIRYEEIVLNYAEALYELSNSDPEALLQLNSIPSNRGATPYITVSKDNILLERRKELIFEGFRFDDLMRTRKSIDVLGSSQNFVKTLVYPNDLFAYPIPASEMNANSNMKQNNGY